MARAVVALAFAAAIGALWFPAAGRCDGPEVPVAERGPGSGAYAAVTPRLVAQIGHSDTVNSVAFSPDGNMVLTGGDTTARLWNAQTAQLLRTFSGHELAVDSVAFSRDGKAVLSGSEDGTARLWDSQTGRLVRTFSGYNGPVTSVSFSPDGETILTGSYYNTAKLWSAQTGQLLHTLAGHQDRISSVAFSPDGKTVLTGSHDSTARLWDSQTGRLVRTFSGHTSSVMSVAFSPDGSTLLTGCFDKTARLWNAHTGNLLRTFLGHTGWVESVAFSPDGKTVLTGSSDRTARLWDAHTGGPLRMFTGHTDQVNSVAFSPDGKTILTGSFDQTARLWSAQSGQLLRTFTGRAHSVNTVAFSPDATMLLTGGTDNMTHLWSTKTGQLSGSFAREFFEVNSVAFSPDGRKVLTGGAGPYLWSAQTRHLLRVFNGDDGEVTSVSFSPDGKTVVAGCEDGTAWLWDSQNGKPMHTLRRNTDDADAVNSVAFSPDGKTVLTGSDRYGGQLWNAKTSQLLRTFPEHADGFEEATSASFSPDGKNVLTGRDHYGVQLWNAKTGQLLRTFPEHADGFVRTTSVGFSPDGKTVVTGSSGRTARLWNAQSGQLLRTLSGHTDEVTSIAFALGGTMMLTGSKDATSKLWDTAAGRELCTLISFDDGTWAVTDPDGRYDASNGGDVEGLHWVVGNEPIDLYQLKERYYEPGLLAKIMAHKPLRPVPNFTTSAVALYPEATVDLPAPGQTTTTIHVTNQGGGIGAVQVLVDGKELTADARPAGFDPNQQTATIPLDLAGLPALLNNEPHQVDVITHNAEGYLASRGTRLAVALPAAPTSTAPAAPAPRLFALIVGISDYSDPVLHLRFPAKDAQDFATALTVGAKRLFGADSVDMHLLTSDQPDAARQPTHANIEAALQDIQQKAAPSDILLVYLSGHGVSFRPKADPGAADAGEDLYCYLTQDARSADPNVLADPGVRSQTALTSEELAHWMHPRTGIHTGKEVLILDTCAAGAAAVRLVEQRDLPSEQIRALDRLKDRTGFHILMGCASDAVSYEADRYGQGVLTYALLQGLRGAALRNGEFADVSGLFQYAADRVPDLASNIGGIQRPEVSAPVGTSFDIGEYTTAEKAEVPVAMERPLILKPVFLDAETVDDQLRLNELVADRLRALSESGSARGPGSAAAPGGTGVGGIVYVDAAEMPGAVQVRGSYTVAAAAASGGGGGTVRVTLRLRRDGAEIGSAMVTGSVSDPAGLADRIAAAIEERAR
jgi:WD40 repeat protein/uncharacterized caspase-like protein